MSVGFKVALLVGVAPGAVWAQECRKDADCGHGFRCLQTSANTSSVTGTGGSSQVECGDGICEGGVEDPDSCPADCDTISYCAPAECDSNADCAEGYECGDEVGGNSSFTSAGGSTSSVCGDDNCDLDENNDNCPEDCPVFRYCQPQQMQCSSDDDCAEGFYCDFGGGSNSVGSVTVSNVDSGTNGTDTATDGSDGTDGTGGASAGFAPPADTTGGTGSDGLGVCQVESSDVGNSSSSDGSSNGGPTDSSATGADTGSSAGNNNDGAGGASAVGGEGSPTNATGSDGDTGSGNDSGGNATGSDGGGAGGSDPGAGGDDGDDDGGCSCAVVGVPASSGFFGALVLGIAAGIRRRRTGS